MSAHQVLDQYLSYLMPHLTDKDVSEVCINRVGEVFVERGGIMTRYVCPELTYERLLRLTEQAGQYSKQPLLSDTYPLIAATLPDGSRIQCVVPPATEPGRIILSIRKESIKQMSLDEYATCGGYAHTQRTQPQSGERGYLLELYSEGRYHEFIKEAIASKCTMLISGGTSSGKTVYLNACLAAVPAHERIITIEDTREVKLTQENVVPLLYPRKGDSSQRHTAKDLVEASLRLRPDRLILGEIRGAEAFDFLHAINTGHPGSIATLHANTPEGALKRLGMMVLQAHTGMTLSEIDSYVRHTIDVIVHVSRIRSGVFGVREIYLSEALDAVAP